MSDQTPQQPAKPIPEERKPMNDVQSQFLGVELVSKALVNFMFPIKRRSVSVLDYFFNRIYSSNSEFWLWRGGIDRLGYGTTKGKHPKAHRLAWELFNGPIPDGMNVLHKCDVRNCVNPDHLFIGTQLDNMRDMVSKGRWRPSGVMGESHGNSKLSEADVTEMRRLRNCDHLAYREI